VLPRVRRSLLLVAVALAVLGNRVYSSAAAQHTLHLRSYDTFGIDADTRRTMEAVVVRMFDSAGIELQWSECWTLRAASTLASCATTLQPHEVVMRIAATPRTERDADVLGFSYIDPQAKRGTLGTVYTDRISALARRRGVDPAYLLGRAIAHEAAHLLLGTGDHASDSVMRQSLADGDFASRSSFSPQEAAAMRNALVERAASAPSLARDASAVEPGLTP
jgi:hypothetical protein